MYDVVGAPGGSLLVHRWLNLLVNSCADFNRESDCSKLRSAFANARLAKSAASWDLPTIDSALQQLETQRTSHRSTAAVA
jgi:hypothetical protein